MLQCVHVSRDYLCSLLCNIWKKYQETLLVSVSYFICVLTNRAYKNGTGKMRPALEMLRPLYSSVYLMILTIIWVFLSPSDILTHQPRMFFYMVGTVFSHICCRLIVAQMSNTRCDGFDWLLFPVTALVAVSTILQPGLIFETTAVYTLVVISTLAQIHYGVCIVSTKFKFYTFGLQ